MKKTKNIPVKGTTLYAGVEAVFLSRSAFVCNITLCRKNKTQLEIVEQYQQLDMETSKKILKKAGQIHLMITGKPVVGKKISKFYENPLELSGVLLPDARAVDFVSQCAERHGIFYGAVIRKDVLHEVMERFCEARLFPQTVLLGPAVMLLAPTLIGTKTSVQTSACSINIEEGAVHFVNTANEASMLSIGEDQIHSYNLPSLCLCLCVQMKDPVFTAIEDEEVKKAGAEALQKNRFKKMLSISVVLLFVLTTANFFANRSYAKNYAELDEQLALNRQMLNDIERIEKDIDEKRSLLGDRPGASGPVISLIGDRIASTVPPKIRLQNMEIFPLRGKVSREKPIGFYFNRVVVEGISNESDVLDKWITQCRAFDWVKDVLIVKYTFDQEKRKGSFKLEFLLQ